MQGEASQNTKVTTLGQGWWNKAGGMRAAADSGDKVSKPATCIF